MKKGLLHQAIIATIVFSYAFDNTLRWMKSPELVARKLLCKYSSQDTEEFLSKIIKNENVQLDYWPLIDVSGMYNVPIKPDKIFDNLSEPDIINDR